MNKLNLFLFFILFLVACSPAKKLETSYRLPVKKMLSEKVKKDRNRNYSAERMRIEISEIQSISASGKMYIQRDEFVFLTVQLLGFEMLRMLITKDSIQYINRLEQKYLFIGMKELQKVYTRRINYKLMENLIVKGLMLPGNTRAKRLADFIKRENTGYSFSPPFGGDQKLIMKYSDNLYLELLEYFNNPYSFFLNSVIEYNDKEDIKKIVAEGTIKNKKIKINIFPGGIGQNTISQPEMKINERYSEINF